MDFNHHHLRALEFAANVTGLVDKKIPHPKHAMQQKINSVAKKFKSIATNNGTHMNQSIHGKVIENKLEDLSVSSFKFHPGRGHKMSVYDKTNCSHGTVTDGFGGTISCSMGKQNFSVLGLYSINSTWNANLPNTTINSIRAQIPNGVTTAVGSNTVTDSPINKSQSTEVVWQKVEYEFLNNEPHPVEIVLQDWQSCQDQVGAVDIKFPDTLINLDATTYSGKAVLASKSMVDATNPDWDLTKCVEVYKFWKLRNLTSVWLQPGARHIHTTFHKKNWFYDARKEFDKGTSPTLVFKFQSTCLGFNMRGPISKINFPGNAQDGNVTFSGGNVSYTQRHTTYVRQRNYLAEYFAIDLMGGHTGVGQNQAYWPGYLVPVGNDKDKDMEVDSPAQVAGF